MKNDILQIVTPLASMRNKPNNLSELETECLFGEKFEVLKTQDVWAFGILKTDGYKGWIEKKFLDEKFNNNYRISSLSANVNLCPNIKSSSLFNLSMNSLINVEEIRNNWAKIRISEKLFKLNFAFVHVKHLISISETFKDWVTFAENFLNVPYKWGGRGYTGIDCSALLQLSLTTAGIYVKRNCKDQIIDLKKCWSDPKIFKRGDIYFWKGHVGIGLDPDFIIHANGFHMKTIIEKRKDALDRIYHEEGPLIVKYHLSTN